MYSKVKTIKYTIIISITSFILAYIVSINKEIGFLRINSQWISNDFAFNVFGGVFASTLVVLLCEIQKYLENKKSAQDYIFYHLYYLYGQLLILDSCIDNAKNDKNFSIYPELLDTVICNIEAENNTLLYAEYYPFIKSKNNKFINLLIRIKKTHFLSIQKFLADCRILKPAVIKDKINNLKNGQNEYLVNCDSQNTSAVLDLIISETKDIIIRIEGTLSEIDKICNDRFQFDINKKTIQENIKNGDYKAVKDRNEKVMNSYIKRGD